MPPAKQKALLQEVVALHRAGKLDAAEKIYRQLRSAAPGNFNVLHLSGWLAYQQGRHAAAVDLLARARRADPSSATCAARLGVALLATGATSEAEKCFRDLCERQPSFAEGWDQLAYCLKLRDELAAAVECHRRAVALEPRNARFWCNLALTLSLLGNNDEALRCHETALTCDPNLVSSIYGRAQVLQHVNRLSDAIAGYAEVLERDPKHHAARSCRLFALHHMEGISREALFREHLAYGESVGAAAHTGFSTRADPERRLRLGVWSPDLRSHSCAYFLEPILRHLDRSQFEIFLYHDHFREDEISVRLSSLASAWRRTIDLSNAAAEKTIRADAPDVMIDLAGHTGLRNRLPVFARRLAPVQISYLGYPNTTGVSAMDYRFTDVLADPIGDADHFATEQLVRFSKTAWCYQPPENSPPLGASSEQGAGVTFGCFNHLGKITDSMLVWWAEILNRTPGSRLLLKGRDLGAGDVQAKWLQRLSAAGLAAERVEFVERTPDTFTHLALYGRVDVALDPFPYHGTTTTCEALWMGVPVVTLAGDRHVSRVGASLLSAIGHPEWIAHTNDDYVRIAVALAATGQRSAKDRHVLRNEMQRSLLMDGAEQAARFGQALRECWRSWCAAGTAAA